MPRVKGGPKTRQRRKKVLKMAKGYRETKPALSNSCGCSSSSFGLCLSRSKGEEKRFPKALDYSHQCSGKASRSLL